MHQRMKSPVGEFTEGAFPVYVKADKQKTQVSYGGETCIFFILNGELNCLIKR